MRSHIVQNKCRKYRYKTDKDQTSIEKFAVKSSESFVNRQICLKEVRKLLDEMVIIDEHSFSIVEEEGFRRLINYLEPRFNIPGRQTVRNDCMLIHVSEKNKLKLELLGKRVCFTTDCWTSIQNLSFMCLTTHYIDDNWVLKKKILNFKFVEKHKGNTIGEKIAECLLDWGIQDMLTLTVGNASSNDTTVAFLRNNFRWKDEILGNKHIHVRCAAHILNLIVREGLKEHVGAILRIRNAVRYVKSSPNREMSFKTANAFTQNSCKKGLVLDVDTRWNSSFDMLKVDVLYEDVFHLMARIDYPYRKYFRVGDGNFECDDDVDDKDLDLCGEEDKNKKLKTASDKRIGPPTHDDFENAKSFVKFLEIFYDATVGVSGSNYITVNNLFLHVIGVHSSINEYIAQVHDPLLSSMASRMKLKFLKYWGKMSNQNLFLYVAVVLDPRYKLKLITYCLKSLYEDGSGEEMTRTVRVELEKLFDQYELCSLDKIGGSQVVGYRGSSSSSEGLKASFGPFGFLSKGVAEHLEKEEKKESNSEIHRYLKDCCEPNDQNFDVLMWWKLNSSKFPILSTIAKDILAIPVSTVASESAFSTSGRVIDSYRSRLNPSTIEALICTQNWLKTNYASSCVEVAIEKKKGKEVQVEEEVEEEVEYL